MQRTWRKWQLVVFQALLAVSVGSACYLESGVHAYAQTTDFTPLALQTHSRTTQVPYPYSRSQLIAHAHTRNTPSFQSVLSRLQDLGYLPLTQAFIHGKNGAHIRHDAFLWPVPLVLQNTVDHYAWNAQNPFIRGAIVQFERNNGILGPRGISEGHLHSAVVRRLFSKTAKKDPWSWEWVLVNKADGTAIPERLDIWRHGKGWMWHTVVNTGVLGSTPNGTWLVYQRLPSTTMRGVFPVPVSYAVYRTLAGKQVPQWAGSTLKQPARGLVNDHPVRWQPYNDPGILWVNYFDDGRGIHYYPRASYGFPQSAGCVEEPYQNAPITYRLLHYGVPVTISRAPFRKG